MTHMIMGNLLFSYTIKMSDYHSPAMDGLIEVTKCSYDAVILMMMILMACNIIVDNIHLVTGEFSCT